MVFNCFRCHAFNDTWKYFEVLQIAQPHIILWWSIIGRSWRGAKWRIVVSLIITSIVPSCLAPSKPPSYGEAMSSLCNCHVEHSSKSFGTLRFNPYSASVIIKVSRAIGDSCTFEFFIIRSTNLCLNALPTFFVHRMHGLIDHFTSLLWNLAIKFPHFVEAFFFSDKHLKCYIEVNP